MATKRKDLSDLQRDLLQLALQGSKGKIWLPKSYQQSFPTTYAAVVGLQRRGLLEAEHGKNPDILNWHVTKEGREALKAPRPEPSPREASPAAATAAQSASKAPPPVAAAAQRPSKAPVSPGTAAGSARLRHAATAK